MGEFASEPIQRSIAVGRVDSGSVRMWLHGGATGAGRLTLRAADGAEPLEWTGDVRFDETAGGTAVLQYPTDDAEPLAPAMRYTATFVDAAGVEFPMARFETAPLSDADCPDRFSFAVMSCHQPFGQNGQVDTHAGRLLRALDEYLDDQRVKRLLLVGDQVYSDLPRDRSLFEVGHFRSVAPAGRADISECTRTEIRELYHQRYRVFWSAGEFHQLQGHFASYPILDDHEIVDNFGSGEAHGGQAFAAIKDGACDAYWDFQGCRVIQAERRPESFDYQLEYGPVAGFVMDLRSEKYNDGETIHFYSDAQFARLEDFLRQYAGKAVVFVVLSVPLVHVPDWLATAGAKLMGDESDAADRWSNAPARSSRDRLLALFHDHQQKNPKQKLVLVGGDVHVGVAAEYRFEDGVPSVWQLVSSPVSNSESPMTQWLAKYPPRLLSEVSPDCLNGACDVRLLKGVGATQTNPVTDLNCGLLQFRRSGDEWKMVLKLVVERDGTMHEAFASAEL